MLFMCFTMTRDQERIKRLTEQLQMAEHELREAQQRCCTAAEERSKDDSGLKKLQAQLKDVNLVNLLISMRDELQAPRVKRSWHFISAGERQTICG